MTARELPKNESLLPQRPECRFLDGGSHAQIVRGFLCPMRDQDMYGMLALVDAIRLGNAREAEFAAGILKRKLLP